MTLEELRRYAVSRAFGEPTDLLGAIRRLGYVQADPIRAPARAQDLILRHRVTDYCVDDLENRYATLPLIEDSIYNYGFFHRDALALLHPRVVSARWRAFMEDNKSLRRRVLGYLSEHTEVHPRDLEKSLGSERKVNGWGGTSSATTLMLEGLHREGRVHVSRRESGIRVYAARPRPAHALSPTARADGLIRLMINLYAPLPLPALQRFARAMGASRPGADYLRRIELMIKRGELVCEKVDHIRYVWPASESLAESVDDTVRFLAPFDPLVWDRARFEHLWGWAYRFEAYTSPARRQLGYYALPLLWRERVVGWANTSFVAGELKVEIGLAAKQHLRGRMAAFNSSLESETERYRRFLRG